MNKEVISVTQLKEKFSQIKKSIKSIERKKQQILNKSINRSHSCISETKSTHSQNEKIEQSKHNLKISDLVIQQHSDFKFSILKIKKSINKAESVPKQLYLEICNQNRTMSRRIKTMEIEEKNLMKKNYELSEEILKSNNDLKAHEERKESNDQRIEILKRDNDNLRAKISKLKSKIKNNTNDIKCEASIGKCDTMTIRQAINNCLQTKPKVILNSSFQNQNRQPLLTLNSSDISNISCIPSKSDITDKENQEMFSQFDGLTQPFSEFKSKENIPTYSSFQEKRAKLQSLNKLETSEILFQKNLNIKNC